MRVANAATSGFALCCIPGAPLSCQARALRLLRMHSWENRTHENLHDRRDRLYRRIGGDQAARSRPRVDRPCAIGRCRGDAEETRHRAARGRAQPLYAVRRGDQARRRRHQRGERRQSVRRACAAHGTQGQRQDVDPGERIERDLDLRQRRGERGRLPRGDAVHARARKGDARRDRHLGDGGRAGRRARDRDPPDADLRPRHRRCRAPAPRACRSPS